MDAISMTQVRLEPQTQTPTFLVVKFISDIRRQEPRNIGVILLHKTGVYSRFFGEDLPDPQNESGIDGRRVKNLISDTKTYEQWVRYWRYCTEPYAVLDPETAALPLAQCYKLLLESSKQNFIVTTGGRILTSDLEHKQPSTMLTWLYNVLVEEDEYGTLENVDLRRATENFLITAGILSHPLLIRDLSVKVSAPKIKKATYRPAFVLIKSHYNVLEPIALHATSRKLSQRIVDSTQFMFERLQSHAKNVERKPSRFITFIDASDDRFTYDVSTFIETLDAWGHALDVSNPQKTTSELANIAKDW